MGILTTSTLPNYGLGASTAWKKKRPTAVAGLEKVRPLRTQTPRVLRFLNPSDRYFISKSIQKVPSPKDSRLLEDFESSIYSKMWYGFYVCLKQNPSQNPSVQSAPVKPTASSKTLETHVPTTHQAVRSHLVFRATSDANSGGIMFENQLAWCWNILKDILIASSASVFLTWYSKSQTPAKELIMTPGVPWAWLNVNHQGYHRKISPVGPGECFEIPRNTHRSPMSCLISRSLRATGRPLHSPCLSMTVCGNVIRLQCWSSIYCINTYRNLKAKPLQHVHVHNMFCYSIKAYRV